jgi:hypothetical protein
MNGFVANCKERLKTKQETLAKEFEIGTWASWGYDQATNVLTFKDEAGVVRVEAVTTFLGSFSPGAGSWMWGWANMSLLQAVRAPANALKRLAEATGIEAFGSQGKLEADEEMAWGLAAMGVEQLGSLGCYRGAAGRSSVFLAIDQIRRVEG